MADIFDFVGSGSSDEKDAGLSFSTPRGGAAEKVITDYTVAILPNNNKHCP